MPDMERPSVLVAGGTGALGEAVLASLLEGGYPVTATWLVERERERVEARFGDAGGLTLVQADVTDERAAAEAVGSVEGLGAVVNLVGGFASGPLVHETELDEFERMFQLNVRPGFLLAKAAMPRLVERGGGAYVG